MSHKKPLASFALISLLFGCSDKTLTPPAPPPPAAVKLTSAPPPALSTREKINAMLMQAVFGVQYDGKTQEARTTMPDGEGSGAIADFIVTAAASTVLATGETVFVTRGEAIDEEGKTNASFATGGMMSVYFMRQRDGKWHIIKRHDNIQSLGSNGNFGGISWPMLGAGKPGMAVGSAYMTQGIDMEMITLFDISNNDVRDVSEGGFMISSSNNGDCDEDLAMECWETEGDWHIAAAKTPDAYGDFLMVVTGTTSTAPGEHKEEATGPRVTEKVSGTARYVFDGKQYNSVSGADLMRAP